MKHPAPGIWQSIAMPISRFMFRAFLRSLVVLGCVVIALGSAAVVSWLIGGLEILPGIREGTPVQIVGFLATFVIVGGLCLVLGLHYLEVYFVHLGVAK